jgi:hypothetical protein
MKHTKLRFLKALTASACLAVGSANAASVLWVTEDSSMNSDWNNFLTNAGYTVSTYLNAADHPNPDAVGAPYTVAQLNAFDLIIAAPYNVTGSGGASLEFHGAVWNTVTTPLIHMGAFGVDGGEWNWFGNNGNGLGPTATYDATDPIFGNIDPTVTPLFSTNTRSGNNVINKNGTILAADSNGNIQIARWVTGDAADGERAFFAAFRTNNQGLRDSFGYLTDEGQTVFLNLAAEFSGIPEPSTALLGGLGMLLLLRRRRG